MAKSTLPTRPVMSTIAMLLVWSVTAGSLPAMAHPSPPKPDVPTVLMEIKRCPPRFRRSTVTGQCVRVPWRLPWLGWYISH